MAAKPGELKVNWSKRERDLLFDWGGAGASKQDGGLLAHALTSKRLELNFPNIGHKFVHSLAEELERRGYDLTTLRFSIQQKIKP